jgi:hypothetical protein
VKLLLKLPPFGSNQKTESKNKIACLEVAKKQKMMSLSRSLQSQSRDKAFIAALGKYLSPVLLEGLPDFVLHFCLLQFFKLC